METLERLGIFLKVFGHSNFFSDILEILQRLSGQFEKFLDSLGSLRIFWKASGHSGKFADTLKTFKDIENFPKSLEIFGTLWKVSLFRESAMRALKVLKYSEFMRFVAVLGCLKSSGYFCLFTHGHPSGSEES